MKQKLRLGDCYALTNHKRKQTTIRYISLLAVLMSMCLYAVKQVSAQQAEPAATAVADIKPLQIGDTIPEWLWNLPLQVVNHPESRNTVTLNDYRGKLIILDFWATWCRACLNGFSKAEELQATFKNEVQFIMVNAAQTEDTPEKIEQTLVKTGLPPDVLFMHGDQIFQQLFPHRILPHYVWIGTDGRYHKSTFQKEVTANNIDSFLRGSATAIHHKHDDLDYDASKPLFAQLSPEDDYNLYQYSLLTGYVEGLGFGNGRQQLDNGLSRLYFINSSLGMLFRWAYESELQGLAPNRLIFGGSVDTDFMERYLNPGDYDNRYSYELIHAPFSHGTDRQMLRNDLQRVFGITVERIVKESDVWEIFAAAERPENGGCDEAEMTLAHMVNLLNHVSDTPLIFPAALRNVKVCGPELDTDKPIGPERIDDLLTTAGIAFKKVRMELPFAIFKHGEQNQF